MQGVGVRAGQSGGRDARRRGARAALAVRHPGAAPVSRARISDYCGDRRGAGRGRGIGTSAAAELHVARGRVDGLHRRRHGLLRRRRGLELLGELRPHALHRHGCGLRPHRAQDAHGPGLHRGLHFCRPHAFRRRGRENIGLDRRRGDRRHGRGGAGGALRPGAGGRAEGVHRGADREEENQLPRRPRQCSCPPRHRGGGLRLQISGGVADGDLRGGCQRLEDGQPMLARCRRVRQGELLAAGDHGRVVHPDVHHRGPLHVLHLRLPGDGARCRDEKSEALERQQVGAARQRR
mmetsp:Transcript_106260/g.297468  ORF Transcript_106260/g.297468 Transcript_106260/m.297468 type:complete len:293 (+) Transcript_106260:256-1134(+)